MTTNQQRHRPRGRRASTLLVVLWAMLILAGVVISWAGVMQLQIEESTVAARRLDARAAALSGLTLAWHPLVKEDSELLRDHVLSDDQSFSVLVEGEGGRLNLNWLIARAQQSVDAERQVEEFLVSLGVGYDEVDVLMDSLIDWVDANDLRRLNGREGEPGYYVGNRPFENLDEVTEVNGAFALTRNPDWRKLFTFWSRGPIDVNWAPAEILRALPGVDETTAELVVEHRLGVDGIRNTEDDEPFASTDEFRSFVGIGAATFELVAPWVMVNDPTKRYVSTGRMGLSEYIVSVVANKQGARATIMDWEED